MDIYILTALFLFASSFITFNKHYNGNRNQFIMIAAVIWLVVFESTRWEIGTDWEAYYKSFTNQEWSGHSEFGYILINMLIGAFSNSYTFFLIVITTFFYVTLLNLLRKYSQAPQMSLVIYYCTMMWLLGCNRQIIAMFICLISLKYVFHHKISIFIVCILIAFSFHSTALFFLPVYYIINKEFSNRVLLISVFVSMLIGLSGIINHIPFLQYIVYLDANSADKLSFYMEGDVYNYSYMGTLKRLLILCACIFVRKRINSLYYDSFLKLYAVGCIIFFLFNGSILQLISSRGALYYNVAEVFIIPSMIIVLFRKRELRVITWIGYFCLILYMMNRDMDSYATGLGYEIFRPYKSILF